MNSEEKDLIILANSVQRKIEESGISMVTVTTENSDVIAAIKRVFGVDTNEITFEMFKKSIKSLYRAGLVNGYTNV